MSRTYRKTRRLVEDSEVSYINSSLCGGGRYCRLSGYTLDDFYNTKNVKRRLTKEEYEKKYSEAVANYNQRMAFFKKFGYRDDLTPYDYNYRREPWYPHAVRKYTYVDVPWSLDQEIEELRQDYRSHNRDGTWTETSRKSGFKEEAAEKVRLANKRFCAKVMRDEDVDNTAYPDGHEGDYLVWNYW